MLRLLALLGGLSVAMDMGTGAPLEESLRRAVLGVRIARALGCAEDEVRAVLDASLLEHLGCTAYAHELGETFGDDVAVIRAGFLADPSDTRDAVRTFVPLVARASGRTRARTLGSLLAFGGRADREGSVTTCEVASGAARRLHLAPDVQQALGHVTAMWDGSGHPVARGPDIPLVARIMHVASVATTFTLLEGPDRADREVHRRAGRHLDPSVAAVVSDDLLAGLADVDALAEVLALEPDPVRLVEPSDLLRVAHTFGDLVDLKSPWLHGHSAAVSRLAAEAAAVLGLPAAETRTVRVAGHLHDVGRIGVSSRIWDAPRELSATERAQVELHPWHTEQVLRRVPALADVATLAAEHHERLDGSGFHRRAVAAQLTLPSRVLATADRYRCLVEDRPYRQGRPPEEAATALRAEARAGRLDGDAVAAVLEAAGHARAARRARPAGLSRRQVDVLRLLAEGRSNREIAAALSISPRTAEHHVQDVYARIGVATRAGAALFALEHGLLGKPG